ncbi:MAG: efflux RND transporter periplasmic adaptor subunit [Rickettsiales bacterium]|nr:efflux RND transporter periplasmic adaptor subunit [Rickettsiales bacterium]
MTGIFKRTYGWKLPIIGALGLIFALVSVLNRPSAEVREPLTPPPQSQFDASIAGIGVVEPKSELISLGVELPGVVRQVHVAVGDSVTRGAPLFSLDQRDIDAQITTLNAALESAKIQASDTKAQYDMVASIKDKRAVARDEVNQRKYAQQLGRARVNEIKAQIAQLQTTKARLTVKAPIDGRILALNVRPGEFASAGPLSEPLVRMGDVSQLYVRVEIDEENAHRIKADSQAEALRRGDTSTRIPLSFVRFEPYIRAKQNLAVSAQRVDTRVLQVLYALPDHMDAAFVGQQMDVFISNPDAKKGT